MDMYISTKYLGHSLGCDGLLLQYTAAVALVSIFSYFAPTKASPPGVGVVGAVFIVLLLLPVLERGAVRPS